MWLAKSLNSWYSHSKLTVGKCGCSAPVSLACVRLCVGSSSKGAQQKCAPNRPPLESLSSFMQIMSFMCGSTKFPPVRNTFVPPFRPGFAPLTSPARFGFPFRFPPSQGNPAAWSGSEATTAICPRVGVAKNCHAKTLYAVALWFPCQVRHKRSGMLPSPRFSSSCLAGYSSSQHPHLLLGFLSSKKTPLQRLFGPIETPRPPPSPNTRVEPPPPQTLLWLPGRIFSR